MSELTFVLTEVEGSTTLRERSPEQMSAAVARHRSVITEAVIAHNGRLVRDRGEGEATFSVFEVTRDGVEAAAAMSRGIAGEHWASETPIRVRIAVYTGEAEERAGDFYGSSVNRAARVRGLAFGGQVLLGSDAAARVAQTLPHGSALVDLGPRALKDLSEPEHVYELRLDEADASEPLSDEECSNVSWLERAASDDFVGRERELHLFAGAWSEASTQRRVLALVAGEPGIGKTALTARAARAVRADGGLVLHGGWDEDVLAPFQGFREALAAYAHVCPRSILRADLRDHGAQLERLFPEIVRRFGVESAPGRTVAEAERLRLFEAVDVWLETIASRRPVMLVLEDVHWADRPSALLLQHLVRGTRPCALLMVATYRDTDIGETDFGRTLPVLSRDRGTLRISLDGLDESNVAEMLHRATGGGLPAGAERLVKDLRSETGGNPFFLQEIVRHLTETGRLDATGVQGRIDVPESVRDIVRWRLSRLSGELGESLAIASVVGQEFDFGVLTAASDIDEDRLLDALDEACRAGLAREHEADRYAFAHAVVRRTLLDDISAARRVRLHRRVGEALEGFAHATPGELAFHFCAAASLGLADKAIEYARAAGDNAMAELAYEGAALHYQRALDVHDSLGESNGALRCELLLALGRAHDKAGEYHARDEQFIAAAEVANSLDRTDLFVDAALGYGGVLPAAAEPDEQGHALLRAALDRLSQDEVRDRALLLARLAHWMHFAAPRTERMAMADEAETMARSLGDPADLAVVLTHRCWAMDGPKDLDDQLRISDEVLELGRRLDDHAVLLEGTRLRTDALFERGEIGLLRAAVDDLSRLADELRVPEYIRIAWTWDAVFATFEGRFEDASLITEKVHDVLRGMGHSQSELVNAALTFPVQWMRGELLEGLPLYEALAQAMPTRLFWPAVVAWCTAEAGMVDKARQTLGLVSRDTIRDMDQNYLWWATIVGFAQAATTLGEREWAEVLIELARPYAGRLCTVGSSGFLGASSHYLGELAATLGNWDEATEHFQNALETHRDMNARPFVALTQMSFARMLFDRGESKDLETAHELQEAAIATALDLGLRAVQNRAAVRFPGN